MTERNARAAAKARVAASRARAQTPTAREAGMSGAILKACAVMRCFTPLAPAHDLQSVAATCGLSSTTAHRILKSLLEGGMLERQGRNLYVGRTSARRAPQYRFGYAAQSEENSFSRLVTESIRSYAYASGIELVLADNDYSRTSALRNARLFTREKVDLVIEFQTQEEVAPRVASMLGAAHIPVIAIEIPHPGALFYGANNYRAGTLAGKALAQACLARWKGDVDEVLLLSQSMAGPLPQTRLEGTIASLREWLPRFRSEKIRIVDGKGRFETSLNATRRFLRLCSPKRLLISGVNDLSCLGALRALQEAGDEERCLIVGQNASIEARLELRKPGSSYVGSVAYFPEQYGEAVIQLGLDHLEERQPPPTTLVRHQLLNQKNVDDFYPNDQVVAAGLQDELLFSTR